MNREVRKGNENPDAAGHKILTPHPTGIGKETISYPSLGTIHQILN